MPPKKMGVNSKAEAAKARRSATEAERKESEARQKEEQYWREAEGSKSRAAKKREEEAEKRAEVVARKAEARRLAELEEKELEKMGKKPEKKVSRVAIPVPKVTEAELRKRREEEQAALAKKSEESKKKQTRTAAEEEYEKMVLVSNTNRDDSVIEARSVEDAIVKMSVAEPLPVDRHPERRLKASFKAFEEAELPRLKEEKPGLTHNQYKDMVWKLWKKSPDNPLNQYEMVRNHTIEPQMLSCRCKTVKKKRTIIAGLNSDTCSREMLLGLLTSVVMPEDNVIAIHVEKPDDTFDPNTFHIHEDLCKSKRVDFQVKVCIGDSYISELTYQVRVSYATILTLGCSSSGLNVSTISACLKGLPPSCTLLVMNSVGRILFQREGTSQQGSVKVALPLNSSQSFSTMYTSYNQSNTTRGLHKSLTIPPAPPPISSIRRTTRRAFSSVNKTEEVSDLVAQKLFHRLALLEAEGSSRHFASQELHHATNNFSSDMVIGEGGHSKVYRATLEDGRAVAVKVLKTTHHSVGDLFREVDYLSSMNHKNIIQIIGFCDSGEMLAIVYDLLQGSLRRNLRQLSWFERMKVAIGVAKALDYLHHSHNPPIIHRDVKSSNILLSHDCEPVLSDFGAAMVLRQSQHADEPFDVVGTFGYLAPEYMMYGKVDEKIDVYSYGVVLLELITGKEAIQTDQEIRESLVLWARSLLSFGICERLIDPYLSEDYNKEEMEVMMIAARLCLMHSSSRRPAMKTILRLFEEPDHWLRMQRERDEFLKGTNSTHEAAMF